MSNSGRIDRVKQDCAAGIDHITINSKIGVSCGCIYFQIAIQQLDVWMPCYFIEGKRIEIFPSDHLVYIRLNIQRALKTVTIKIQVRPLAEDDRLKESWFYFPEAPGAIVMFFGFLFDKEDLFILQLWRCEHSQYQAETGTARAGNDVIVLLRCSND